jgi:hypothetical protein
MGFIESNINLSSVFSLDILFEEPTLVDNIGSLDPSTYTVHPFKPFLQDSIYICLISSGVVVLGRFNVELIAVSTYV